MKIIVLYGFGGLLKSEYIAVQDYPRDYRVPYRKGNFSWVTADLSKDLPTFRTARFVPSGKYVVLENQNTALIYELEEM